MKPSYPSSNIVKKCTVFLIAVYLIFTEVHAQQTANFFDDFSIGIQSHYGSLLATVPKAAYVRDSYTSFIEVYVAKQSKGKLSVANNYPQTGLAFLYGNPGSKEYVGKTVALFPFVLFPLIQKEKFKTGFRLGTGLAWIEKPYDVHTNHKNTLIGSHINSYIGIGLMNEIKLNPSLYVNAGASFSHISNGSIKLPNFGLNMPALSAGLRYTWNKMYNEDSATTISYLNKKTEFNLFLSGGVKQTPWAGSPHYFVTIATAEVVKPLSSVNYIGAGVDLFYDPSLTKDPSGYKLSNNKLKNMQVGLHVIYERKLEKLSIPLQAGIYLLHANRRSIAYQTIGLRYRINKHLSAVYHLKTHTGKADYIHAGLGYHF